MQLATDAQDYAEGSLGLVETASSFLNDRGRKMWSKGELISHINSAQWTIAGAINRLHKEYFLTSATADLVAGQADYTLPADLAELVGLEVLNDITDTDPQDLVTVHIDDRRFYQMLDQAAKKDDYRFYFVAGTSFHMQPQPSAVTAEKVRAHYVKRLARLVQNPDVSEIDERYHTLIAMDAARLALIKTKQQNAQLERMRAEAFQVMQDEVRIFTVTREEIVEPFYGTYGPGPKVPFPFQV